MFKSLLFKLSGLSLRAYRFFDGLANSDRNVTPYRLRYSPDPNNPKIIHVIGNFIVGGSTQLVVDIIERTSDSFLHKVVVPQVKSPLAYEPIDIYGFSIEELSGLADFLIAEDPTLVHIHYFARESDRYDWGALWYQTIFRICEDLEIPVIQNINVPTEPWISSAIVHNVFVSEYVRDNFSAADIENSVIYPGSDFSHFNQNETDTRAENCIGMVYRLDDDKLRPESIEVFIEAVKLKPDLKCLIIGAGSYLELYKQRVHDAGLVDNFQFTGYVSFDSLPDWYRKMSIFVTPVYDESFGQVTPFAMSMGLSVAGYDTGAIGEILGYKDTLVTTGDIGALAKLIVELLDDEGILELLGNRNRLRAIDHFSVEKMTACYNDLYRKYSSEH